MQPLLNSQNELLVEQREYERYQAVSEIAYVYFSTENRVGVTAIDFSDGGLGIAVQDREPFKAGVDVEVEFRGKRKPARIIYVQEIDPDYIRVGLAWQE